MLRDVSNNIQETIGVPFEILSYENSKGKQGICELYNIGAKQATFDILCFMHEDIVIRTLNWGGILKGIFMNNPKLGVIGLAGATYKCAASTGWEVLSFEHSLIRRNYIQRFKFSDTAPQYFNVNPDNNRLSKVVSVDGMWFCTTKEVTSKFAFDEQLLKGFHGYDLDFCYQVRQEYDIAVTYDILLEHFSEGHYGKDWWQDNLKLHKKWQKMLPVGLEDLSSRDKFLIEKRGYRWIIERLSAMGYSLGYVSRFLISQKYRGLISWQLYFKGNLFALKYFFRKGK